MVVKYAVRWSWCGGVSDSIETPVALNHNHCHMYPASTLLSYGGGESRPSDVDGAWGLDVTRSVS